MKNQSVDTKQNQQQPKKVICNCNINQENFTSSDKIPFNEYEKKYHLEDDKMKFLFDV